MHCRLTEPLGMRIAEFPLNPMFAKMLLESGRRKKITVSSKSCNCNVLLEIC